MAFVLDSGALIAVDRGDRAVFAAIEAARRREFPVVTSSGCVAQVWRKGGPKQARLARVLVGVFEVPLNDSVSRAIGALCADTHTSDVVDAHLAVLMHDGDVLFTSDVGDLRKLTKSLGVAVEIQLC
jgi:hypothetical protein